MNSPYYKLFSQLKVRLTEKPFVIISPVFKKNPPSTGINKIEIGEEI